MFILGAFFPTFDNEFNKSLTKNPHKMRRILFGLLACVTLLAVSCETNDTASDDQLYEVGVDKGKVIKATDGR